MLSSIVDYRAFRVQLSRPQGAIGRREGATGPGNRNKRIRLAFQVPEPFSQSVVADVLTSGEVAPADININQGLHVEHGQAGAHTNFEKLKAILHRYEYAAPSIRQRAVKQIERGPIGELVKNANGRRCQICMAFGLSGTTFKGVNGKHYVEAHHVEPVSSNAIGVLRVSNVVTLCANHHRELHMGASATVIDDDTHFIVTVEQGTVRITKATIGIAATK